MQTHQRAVHNSKNPQANSLIKKDQHCSHIWRWKLIEKPWQHYPSQCHFSSMPSNFPYMSSQLVFDGHFGQKIIVYWEYSNNLSWKSVTKKQKRESWPNWTWLQSWWPCINHHLIWKALQIINTQQSNRRTLKNNVFLAMTQSKSSKALLKKSLVSASCGLTIPDEHPEEYFRLYGLKSLGCLF